MSSRVATGPRPVLLPLELEAFAGPVLHLQRADEVDGQVAGRRIGVVGDPVGIAGVTPALAASAACLKVFQTDGAWILPRLGGPAALTTWLPRLAPVQVRRRLTRRIARAHLRAGVPDGWTRRQLTPSQPPSRSNIAYSSTFYRVLRHPHVELVTWPIARVVAEGVRTADGIEHHLDALVVVEPG